MLTIFTACSKTDKLSKRNNQKTNKSKFKSSFNPGYDPEKSRKQGIVCEKIKERTKRDLKKLGIKKLLTSKGAGWGHAGGLSIDFKTNNRLYISDKGNKFGYGYWKVKNNVLYIHPNNNQWIYNQTKITPKDNRFHQMDVKPIKPGSYSRVGLPYIKYAISMDSKNKNMLFNLNFYVRKKVN